ncbi:MAG: 16S rRNA (cytosine(1402)-N(4))-methyltransferase RsmH [Deltaproteobacteria bacterium]|nr:16S rRNA (cytosine(1402)-N(4))-methyltransferase RsmH [Deltaproteobacteria bacterium]
MVHAPVLMKEVLELLKIIKGGVYLDGTVGLGGHAAAILKEAEGVRVIGIDRDLQALELIKQKLHSEVNKRLFLYHGNFKDILKLKNKFKRQKFDGALLDLGVSSFQLGEAARGFSFQKEGPLDMRMDTSQKEKAFDLVNTLPEKELSQIFYDYGEERFSSPIAHVICERRKQKPLETTLELANLISELTPLWKRGTKIHPATRVFQALRIAVNQELENLDRALEDILTCLKKGGRLVVISFHSLEDRIVKQSFFRFENPCICPPDFPKCACGKKPLGHRVTSKPRIASEEEVKQNPRSRSAKLRAIERIGA